MVNTRAIRTAALAGGGLFALLFVGTIWQFISRIASFAVMASLVVAAVYVAYEVHSGWLEAGTGDRQERSESAEDDPVIEDRSVSTTELDAEIERLREETDGPGTRADETDLETET